MANFCIISILSLAFIIQTALALPFNNLFSHNTEEQFRGPWKWHHHNRPHFRPFPTLNITSTDGIFPTGTAGADPTGTALPTGGTFIKRQFFSFPTSGGFPMPTGTIPFPTGMPVPSGSGFPFPTGKLPIPTGTGTISGFPTIPTAVFKDKREIEEVALEKRRFFEGPRHHKFRPHYPFDPHHTFSGGAAAPTATVGPVPTGTGTAVVSPVIPIPTGSGTAVVSPVVPIPTGTGPASSGFPVPTFRY